jgi:hypothetical protein
MIKNHAICARFRTAQGFRRLWQIAIPMPSTCTRQMVPVLFSRGSNLTTSVGVPSWAWANNSSSTPLAWRLKTANYTPRSIGMAPRGRGSPGCTGFVALISEAHPIRCCAQDKIGRGTMRHPRRNVLSRGSTCGNLSKIYWRSETLHSSAIDLQICFQLILS